MFRLHITIDENTLANVRRSLGDTQHRSRQAVSGAINDTLSETKTRSAKRIYDKFNLSSARIKRDIDLVKSTPQTLSGEVRFEHKKPIGLAQFGATQPKRGKGVYYKIERSGQRKFIEHAFIRVVHGVKHVFIRYKRGSTPISTRSLQRKQGGTSALVGRYPLYRFTGLSVKEAFVKSGLAEEEVAETQAVFEKNLQQRINSIIEGHWKER